METYTIEIDEDVHAYLLRSAIRIGEDASSILRRQFRIPKPDADDIDDENASTKSNGPGVNESQELRGFLLSSRFGTQRTATNRFLDILSFVYRSAPDQFERVLGLSGRHRRYFGRTQHELSASGKSVHAKKVPDSPYWVMTNASTSFKKQILRDALKLLDYHDDEIRAATKAIG